MGFLDQLFAFTNKNGPVISALFLIALTIIIVIYRLDIIVGLFKKSTFAIKKPKSDSIIDGKAVTINTNILIYLFEIHTHYKEESTREKYKMINKQLDFAEQIMDQIIDNSCKAYREQQEKQIEILKKIKNKFEENHNKPFEEWLENDLNDNAKVLKHKIQYLEKQGEVIKEFTLFKDAIRCAFYFGAKKKFEDSFEKNGFYGLGENDLKVFVEQKTDMIVSNITKQLTVYFPVFNYMLIQPDSFIMSDIVNKEYINGKVMEIYKNAINLYKEYNEKEEYLKQEFQRSINTLMLQNIFEID